MHHRASLVESSWQEWLSQPLKGQSGIAANVNDRPSQETIAKLGYALWEERARPWGEAEQDWYRAERQLAGWMTYGD